MPTNSFHAAIAQAAQTINEASPVEVTVNNGTTEITLECTVGRTDAESEGDDTVDGLFGSWQTRDYLVRPSLLNFDDGSGVVKPTTTWTIVENGETFQVTAPPGGKPWRWMDNGRRSLIRIHTQKV